MNRATFALIALLAVTGFVQAGHPTASLDLEVFHGLEASSRSSILVSYHAHGDSATTAIDTTVATLGCSASAITSQEDGGHEAGTFTLAIGRDACSFEVVSTATEGADVNVYRYSGTIKVGSTGAVLEEWLPLFVYVALILWAGHKGNFLLVMFGIVGFVSERAEAPIMVRTAILVLCLVALFPQLWLEQMHAIAARFRGEKPRTTGR